MGDPGHRRDGHRLERSCSRIFPVTPVSPLPPTGEAVGFALSLLAGVIVAPFGEEILFRAFATTAWVRGLGVRRGLVRGGARLRLRPRPDDRRARPRARRSGSRSSASASRIPIALALGWIFLRRGTIWASFGLHAAFNGILLVVAEVASRRCDVGRGPVGAAAVQPAVEPPMRGRR